MRFAVRELMHGKKKYILITLLLILLMFMVPFLSGLATGFIMTDTYTQIRKALNPMYRPSVHALAIKGDAADKLWN